MATWFSVHSLASRERRFGGHHYTVGKQVFSDSQRRLWTNTRNS